MENSQEQLPEWIDKVKGLKTVSDLLADNRLYSLPSTNAYLFLNVDYGNKFIEFGDFYELIFNKVVADIKNVSGLIPSTPTESDSSGAIDSQVVININSKISELSGRLNTAVNAYNQSVTDFSSYDDKLDTLSGIVKSNADSNRTAHNVYSTYGSMIDSISGNLNLTSGDLSLLSSNFDSLDESVLTLTAQIASLVTTNAALLRQINALSGLVYLLSQGNPPSGGDEPSEDTNNYVYVFEYEESGNLASLALAAITSTDENVRYNYDELPTLALGSTYSDLDSLAKHEMRTDAFMAIAVPNSIDANNFVFGDEGGLSNFGGDSFVNEDADIVEGYKIFYMDDWANTFDGTYYFGKM